MFNRYKYKSGDFVIADVEAFENYFLAGFKHCLTGDYWSFELSADSDLDIDALNFCLFNYCLVGFNFKDYDIPMLFAAIAGLTTQELKHFSNIIIQNPEMKMGFMRDHDINIGKINFIDLMEVAPLKASLKIYGARLHSKQIIELPYDHNTLLTREQGANVKKYNRQDLDVTHLLFDSLKEQIDLRYQMTKEYGIDVRSKSDAQIAEAVIVTRLENSLQRRIYTPTLPGNWCGKYKQPDGLHFTTPALKELLDDIIHTDYRLDGSGKVAKPSKEAKRKVPIGNALYTVGIGGLHSNEKCQAVKAENGYRLFDIDAASFYPFIILIQKLFPKHLGQAFLEVYRDIVYTRIDAKKKGKTDPIFKAIAESLKIVINGSFGKLGSPFSKFYSPDLLLQTTLSGQLFLLMLVETFEQCGIQIVNGNTDGIVAKVHESQIQLMDDIIEQFERDTELTTEKTEYTAIYSRDVNNYLAFKTDGTVKGKGVYFNPWGDPKSGAAKLSKNPAHSVCVQAAIEHIKTGQKLEDYIHSRKDVREFVSVRKVADGAEDAEGEHIGTAARWYYAKHQYDPLRYKKNAHIVGDSVGAKPLMELPNELPIDLDHGWYVKRAKQILVDIGFTPRVKNLSFF